VGKCLGKAAGPLSFAEVVHSKPTFPSVVGLWSSLWRWLGGEVEQFLQWSLEQATVRQVVDCFALETSPSIPLGIDQQFRVCKQARHRVCR
jgi:hypothetical protein